MPRFNQLANRVKFNVALAPVSKSAGSTTSSAIDLTGYSKAALLVSVGVISSSGTVDCKVQSSATSGGSYADITGAAITQMTQAGGDSDDTVQVDFEIPNGQPFVKTVLVNATAAAIQSVHIIGDQDIRS
tara:strand:+ start:130 stop:519 length:390 start_codon:yes stop_codon:yes gene_type:complete